MVITHVSLHWTAQVDDVVLLEGDHYILEASAQVGLIAITKRVGNYRKADKITFQFFKVDVQLRPIAACKEGVAPHTIAVRKTWYLTF
jgi:hypothetical protein